MYSSHSQPFLGVWFYLLTDALFLIFAVLYNIGDSDHMDNGLKYVKAIPVYIIIIQLFSLRNVHRHIKTVMVGLFFGSIGDWCLLWGSQTIPFAIGALAFLIGHVIYVTAFVFFAEDAVENKITLKQVLSYFPIYLAIWLVLMTFSFASISTVISYLISTSDEYLKYVLDVYGTVLTLLTMGGFFIFFVAHKVSSPMFWSGLMIMLGCLIFYASDNFIAHGKYNTWYMDRVSQSTNSYLIMITYYVAQFLIGKGTFYAAIHFTQHIQTNDGNKGQTNLRI